MKCLIAAQFYTPDLLCYLLNEINTSLDHFNESFIYFDKLKTNSKILNNEDFGKLLEEMNKLTRICHVIKDVASLFRLLK